MTTACVVLHYGDVGAVIELTATDCNGVVEDISAATTLEIYFQKPDGTTVTKTAVFTTDGTDGKFQYTTIAGDLDMVGTWHYQGHIVTPTTSLSTDIADMIVYQVLAIPIVGPSYDEHTGQPVAKTRTFLSIDRYAEIVGINPVFFNQGAQINLSSGVALFPHGAGTPSIDLTWQQHQWNVMNNVSREELAFEIKRAEREIESFLGYAPAPDWTDEELVDMHNYFDKFYGKVMYDLRGDHSGFRIKRRKFIAPGRRASDFVDTVIIDYVDEDGDGWEEIAKITVDLGSADIDTSEYKIYFTGNNGNPLYEIRPARVKYMTGTILTMKFDSWKFIELSLKHAHPTNDTNSINIDISNLENLATVIDIYREYNDETAVSATFVYEDGTESDASLILKNARTDYVEVDPEGCSIACCGYPRFVKLWYYSGNKCSDMDNFYGDWLDPVFARAIAMLATARLERPIAGNVMVTAYTQKMQVDMTSSEGRMFRYSDPILYQNPFGTRYGEFGAYKLLMNFEKRK